MKHFDNEVKPYEDLGVLSGLCSIMSYRRKLELAGWLREIPQKTTLLLLVAVHTTVS